MLKWERSKERFDYDGKRGRVSCEMEDMKPYDALPCEIDTTYNYFLNGISFDIDDFGTFEAKHEGYCCCNAHFEEFDEVNKETLKKYGIDEDEYEQIEGYLVDILYVGSCGWCE